MNGTTDASAARALMTPREAAEIAGVSERHIRKLCERGELRAVKLGKAWRVNRAAFLALCGIDGDHAAA